MNKIDILMKKDKIYEEEMEGLNSDDLVNIPQNEGIIYGLYSKNSDRMYIGATMLNLLYRYYNHLNNNILYKQKQQREKKNKNIRKENKQNENEIIERGDTYIEKLMGGFTSREEMCKMQSILIRKNRDKCINKMVPLRTMDELFEDILNGKEIEYYRVSNKKVDKLAKIIVDNKLDVKKEYMYDELMTEIKLYIYSKIIIK